MPYLCFTTNFYTFRFKDPKNLVSCDVAYLRHTMWVTQDHTYLKNRWPSQVLSSIPPLISYINIACLVLYWPIWEGVKPFLASLYICSLTSSAVNLSHWYQNHNKRYTLNQHTVNDTVKDTSFQIFHLLSCHLAYPILPPTLPLLSRLFLSIALCILPAHDFFVIRTQKRGYVYTQRKKFPTS